MVFRCPDNDDVGLVPEFTKLLSRAYPRAAPGRLVSLASDPDAGTLSLAGVVDGAGSAPLDVWSPGTKPPVVTGSNLANVTITAVAGGFRVRADVTGGYRLDVAPTP